MNDFPEFLIMNSLKAEFKNVQIVWSSRPKVPTKTSELFTSSGWQCFINRTALACVLMNLGETRKLGIIQLSI